MLKFMTIYLATTSKYKLKIANNSLSKYGIKVEQLDIETPEIQSFTSEEVAKYSAQWAAEKSGKPVIKNDVGLYIEGLNGFPGPYIKYLESWFTDEAWRSLLQPLGNRDCYWIDALGYCEPGKEPVCFTSKTEGSILPDISKVKRSEFGFIDGAFVPEGYDKPIVELSEEEALELWDNEMYDQLAEYLESGS